MVLLRGNAKVLKHQVQGRPERLKLLKCDSPSVSSEPRQLGSVEELRAALALCQHESASDRVCFTPQLSFYSYSIPFFQKIIDLLKQSTERKIEKKIEKRVKIDYDSFREKEKVKQR